MIDDRVVWFTDGLHRRVDADYRADDLDRVLRDRGFRLVHVKPDSHAEVAFNGDFTRLNGETIHAALDPVRAPSPTRRGWLTGMGCLVRTA